jgi:hypothetical protein
MREFCYADKEETDSHQGAKTQRKIRNSNIEIRNKFKIQITECSKPAEGGRVAATNRLSLKRKRDSIKRKTVAVAPSASCEAREGSHGCVKRQT